MSKKQNDITRYVNFTDYKEPVNLDYGWSSISSFVTLVVIGFFAFYLIFIKIEFLLIFAGGASCLVW